MKKRILVVDDNDDYRESIMYILEDLKYEVEGCSGGKKAYDMTYVKKFDLVLSDVRMPEGDGVELLLRLRQRDPSYPLVILMTGFSVQDFGNLKEKGAYAILEKPFEISHLEKVISTAISS